MRKRIIFPSNNQGKSRLEGYNFNGYPIHKFRNINDPGPTIPLWPYSCGLDEWRKECFRERTFSDTFAVEYVQSGVFIFQQNHITMKVNPGEIFLVHLDQDNSMRCETDFAMKRTIIMRGGLLRSALTASGLTRISRIVPETHEKIDRIFDRIYELCGESSQESRREMSVLCYSLLVELAGQSVIGQRPAELQRALEYIHGHLDAPMSLDELIRHSGVSGATLHRQFRKFMKTSPIDYYLDQKLERAKVLLENHLYSVKEVAEILHYASPQYFASQFRKKYGVPPKSFKIRITYDSAQKIQLNARMLAVHEKST